MSLLVSYFIIPLAIYLLLINIYFRLKITRQYKSLAKQNIDIHPKVLLDRKRRMDYFKKFHPLHVDELQGFATNLDKLIILVIVGFTLILLSFLYLYFNR